MPSSIESIFDGFPFPTIDLIVGTPDYESIADIHLKLNLNAASVHYNLGCGTLGLLFLTVSPAVYATLSNIAFVPPVNPGPELNIPDGATGATISDLRYHHAVATNIFTKYKNTDKSLCPILLASTGKLYVRSLCQKYIVYGKTTKRALPDHLYSTYANISASALQDNNAQLRAPYDSNQPLKSLLIRSKMWWTTPTPETRPTPLPKLSQLLSSSCSIPDSSMTTTNSGGANQLTTRPGHASKNSLQLPPKNGRSCRPPRPVPYSSRPFTPISQPIMPIKMKRSNPLPTLQQPLPVIAPWLQLSLRSILHSPPTALLITHRSALPFRTSQSFRLPSPTFASNSALQASSPPVATKTTTSEHVETAATTIVESVPILRRVTRRMLLATTKKVSKLLPDISRELLILRILFFQQFISCNTLVPALKPSDKIRSIVDSGCASHFIVLNKPCINKVPTKHGISVRLPNGETMQSTHTTMLPLPQLPLAARQSHVSLEL